MKRAWMVAAALLAAPMEAQTGSHRPQANALVTVFTYDSAGVPWDTLARAKRVATSAFAAAGIEIRWVRGKRLGAPREVSSGEVLTVVFDSPAPVDASPGAMAFTNVGGWAAADVHVFYSRVAGFGAGRGSHAYMPEFLGNVLAHELTHALEGVVRHSSEGLMKAAWSNRDCAEMVLGPLPFAAVDLELLRAHFRREVSPAPTLIATR